MSTYIFAACAVVFVSIIYIAAYWPTLREWFDNRDGSAVD